MGLAFGVARLLVAVGLFLLSVLTLVPVPVAALWKPAVLATEWGHALAALSVLLLTTVWIESRLAPALGFAAAAAVLFMTPTFRAMPLNETLPARWDEAFGPGEGRTRSVPFEPRDLFLPVEQGRPPTTHVFADRADGLSLDLYPGEGNGPRPLVVAIHGGSWQTGDRTQLAEWWSWIATQGWTVAAIDHRKAPGDSFPAQKVDVNAAIDWLKAHAVELEIDSKRIVLIGRSSGGHLALTSAYANEDPAIVGVVAWYAPTDLVWSWENPANPLVIRSQSLLFDLMDAAPDEKEALYRQGSPIQQARSGSPPTLLLHGGRDELVWPEQSRRLSERLRTVGVPHLVVDLPWATHGCDANLSGPSGQIGRWAIERFLARAASR